MGAGDAYQRAPARVYWELTRACDLACHHCRAEAMRERARGLHELAAVGPPRPHVVFTGGDPLKRPDLREARELRGPSRPGRVGLAKRNSGSLARRG